MLQCAQRVALGVAGICMNLFIAFSEDIVVDLYTRRRLRQHRAILLIAFGEWRLLIAGECRLLFCRMGATMPCSGKRPEGSCHEGMELIHSRNQE